MGLVELFALPGIFSLLVLSADVGLALAPRRMLRILGDGFGFDVAFRPRRSLKGLCTQAVGLALAGYGCYLLLLTVQLWMSFHPGGS